jgi:hypothetical protein
MSPPADIDTSPVALTLNFAAEILTPDLSMVMLFDPTCNVIDVPALIVLVPALTVIEWLPFDTVRLSLPADTVTELLPWFTVSELSF